MPTFGHLHYRKGFHILLRWLGASENQFINSKKFGEKIIEFNKWATVQGAFLELGCPGPGMSIFEYQQKLIKIKPDAAQIFGCGIGASQMELLLALGKVIKKIGKNIYLTTAASQSEKIGKMELSHLRFFEENLDEQSELVESLRKGEFSFVAGGFIRLNGAQKATYSEIASIQKSKALKHGYTITVELALENSVKARKLIVYSESGPVMGQLLTDETLKNRFFKIVVPWDSRDKYIRLEVRGSHRSSSMNQLFDRGAGSHLGSSNFVKIASVLIPQGD